MCGVHTKKVCLKNVKVIVSVGFFKNTERKQEQFSERHPLRIKFNFNACFLHIAAVHARCYNAALVGNDYVWLSLL